MALPALAPWCTGFAGEGEAASGPHPGSDPGREHAGCRWVLQARTEICPPAEYPLKSRWTGGDQHWQDGPIVTREELKEDPLLVSCEPYNTLILDRKGFLVPSRISRNYR